MLLSSLNTFEKNTEIKIHSEPLNLKSSLNTTQSPFKVEYIEKSKFNPLKNNKSGRKYKYKKTFLHPHQIWKKYFFSSGVLSVFKR